MTGHLVTDNTKRATPVILIERLVALHIEQRMIEAQLVAALGVEQASAVLIAAYDNARATMLARTQD